MPNSDRKARLVIRVFIGGVKQVEDWIEVDPDKLDDLLPELAKKHASMLALRPGWVEIEFLDEPDVNARFFRMGTDKSAMVNPLEIDLTKPADEFLSKWGGSKRGGK